jgi:hypothetical protein
MGTAAAAAEVDLCNALHLQLLLLLSQVSL